MSKLKTKINDAISEHIDSGNSYTYQLIRTKEAFQYGTVTLDDFIEWDDDAVEELSNDIMKALQPKLSENQEIVLEWLITYATDECITPIDTVASFWRARNRELQPENWRLSKSEQAEVLQAFANWALDQC